MAKRVNGEKKHSVSDATRTALLTDLWRWPGDMFFGQNTGGGALSQFWFNVPPPGGAAGRLLCRAGSAAGMWRAGYQVSKPPMLGRNVMLENTSGTCVFEVPRNWKQVPTIFWLLVAARVEFRCRLRRAKTHN